MPRLSDDALVKLAEEFEANKDMYAHPAWRKLMDGVAKQRDAVKQEAIEHVFSQNGKINTELLCELRGRFWSLSFLHEFGSSHERVGQAAKDILVERAIKHAD